MSQSEIVYEKLRDNDEYEEISSTRSLLLKKHDTRSEFGQQSYDGRLIPYRFDNDTNSNFQDETFHLKNPLCHSDFGDDKSSDFLGSIDNSKLFAQIYRFSGNFSSNLSEKSSVVCQLDNGAPFCQVIPPNETTTSCYLAGEKTALNQIVPILQCRKPLPLLDFEKTPVYVNAKQYDRILKLRNRKLEEGRIKGPNYIFERPKSKTFRHESRSQHAKNRRRNDNGKFQKKGADEDNDDNHGDDDVQEVIKDKSDLCPKIRRR